MKKSCRRSQILRAKQCLAAGLVAVSALSCGQTVEWSWTPPPGTNWSPIVGTFPVRCRMDAVQVLADLALNGGGGRGYHYLTTMMRIRQLSPQRFRMILWEGAGGANNLPDDIGHPFTLYGTNFTQVFQRGEVAPPSSFGTWTTVSGEGRVRAGVLSLVWRVQEVSTATFERYGLNTEIVFEFQCTGTPPGRP